MSVLAIGLNHRTTPLALLERMTVDATRLPKLLTDLVGRAHVTEAVVLSTCNRVEIYVEAERFHGGYQDARDALAEHCHLAPEDFSDHVYTHYESAAVAHLFGVAAGLDSAVLGESEVLGQVKTAWDRARSEGSCGTVLNQLFRQTLEVGKAARTETGIARNITSVSQAAVALAAERLDGLEGSRVLVLGAGDMGEGMAVALADRGLADLAVANRTWDNARSLAERVGGRAVRLADVAETLAAADLLLTGTGATSIMLEHADLVPVVSGRSGAPLLIVDAAVPRDVDPSVAELAGVTLLDMDDLRAFAQVGVDERRREVAKVRRIIELEVQRHEAAGAAREVAPVIAGLHQRAEAIRQAELDRFAGRLADLDERQRDAVQALTQGLIGKLLHDPSTRLTSAAGTSRGELLADALGHLFDLDD